MAQSKYEMPEEYKVPQIESTVTRVDVWMATVSNHSRTRIKSLIESGFVFRNDVPVSGASSCIRSGEVYRIDLPQPKPGELVAQSIPLDILYEDDFIIVLNKPSALVVHPAVGHPDGTLVNALLAHCPDMFSIGGEMRPGIVHRLDQDTSGVMVVAKTDAAMVALSGAFQDGRVGKTYQAIVHGLPDPLTGRIESLIGRDPVHRQRMAVVMRNGKQAITNYEVVETFASAARLQVTIETGRTHQIRVHLKHIGCPVAGDSVYGRAKADSQMPVIPKRQMLHAWRLIIPHPESGTEVQFEAPFPDDFIAVLKALR